MLYDFRSGKKVTHVPHPKTWRLIERLSPQQRLLAEAYIEVQIERREDIANSSWMAPGPEWTDTPLDPIYWVAARQDFDLAAKLYGLLVWHVFMEHPEAWSVIRCEKDGELLSGLTYFRYQRTG